MARYALTLKGRHSQSKDRKDLGAGQNGEIIVHCQLIVKDARLAAVTERLLDVPQGKRFQMPGTRRFVRVCDVSRRGNRWQFRLVASYEREIVTAPAVADFAAAEAEFAPNEVLIAFGQRLCAAWSTVGVSVNWTTATLDLDITK